MSNELTKEQIENADKAWSEVIASRTFSSEDFFKAIAPHLQYHLDGWLRLCKEYSCNQTPESLGACFARQKERLEEKIKTLKDRLSSQTTLANQFGHEAREAREEIAGLKEELDIAEGRLSCEKLEIERLEGQLSRLTSSQPARIEESEVTPEMETFYAVFNDFIIPKQAEKEHKPADVKTEIAAISKVAARNEQLAKCHTELSQAHDQAAEKFAKLLDQGKGDAQVNQILYDLFKSSSEQHENLAQEHEALSELARKGGGQ